MEFKTYDEFKEDLEKEIIDGLDTQEKLEIYNHYCEYNNDYDSMLYENDEDFFKYTFNDDFDDLVRAITRGYYSSQDYYVKLDRDGDLRGYWSLSKALEDNFVGDDLIDFTMRYNRINVKDLYDLYIKDTIAEAKESMTPEEFEKELKEYNDGEMIEKYPEVCEQVDFILQ